MKVSTPTYLIAELSGDVVPLVLDMRKRFNPKNTHWPADITIAGSSGVGTLKDGQHLNEVVEQLTPIVREFGFTDIEFVSVSRFPNTGIYYLMPAREKFDCLHKAVVHSTVEFNESDWPYNPHCTLRWHDDDAKECKTLFDSLKLPIESAVDCFSLYQPQKNGGCRVHRFKQV